MSSCGLSERIQECCSFTWKCHVGLLAVQIKWGVEVETDVFSAYVENISGENCHLDLHHAVSMDTFVEGKPPRELL